MKNQLTHLVGDLPEMRGATRCGVRQPAAAFPSQPAGAKSFCAAEAGGAGRWASSGKARPFYSSPAGWLRKAAAGCRTPGRFALLALLTLFFSGCAVSFVSGYDPVTDAGIQEVAKKTETIISDVLANKSGAAVHRENYREAQGALAAVGLRAELYGEKNKAEREIVAKLKLSLAELEELHRMVGSFRPAEAEGVRSLLRTLMHHELSKKNSSALVAREAGR